jgi:hypothetical protein
VTGFTVATKIVTLLYPAKAVKMFKARSGTWQ